MHNLLSGEYMYGGNLGLPFNRRCGSLAVLTPWLPVMASVSGGEVMSLSA